MRVLVVDTYYAAFLDEHYGARPGLAGRPYAEQLTSLIERSFGTSDAFSTGLRAAGHEAAEVVANCLPLQARWSSRATTRLRSRAGPRARERLLRRIAREQVTDFEADVVLCQDMSFFERSDLDAMRAEGRLVVGQIASPPPDEDRVRAYDLVLTSFPHFVERFRALGVASEYLRLAFPAKVLDRLGAKERRRPLTFVGSVHPGVHGEGVTLLERVAAEMPLEAFGYGAEQLPEGSSLAAAHAGEAWGLDMYRLLAESRVTLNRHIAAAEGHANNMRLFEATGVGALLLTDAAPNLHEMFEPGIEVVTYTDADDLIEKARHYLEHEDERAAIAGAGQARTLREHTYERRAVELAAILEERLR
jgi:spore maturation protein CgeB